MGFVLATLEGAHSYVQSESTQRVPIQWGRSHIPLIFTHNPSDVSAAQSSLIVNDVVALWNAISPVSVGPSNSGNNSFSYSSDSRFFGPGVVAVTVLNYNPGEGRVASGQIYVNQSENRNFCLTTDKTASSCTVPGAGLLTKVYLGDVVAHEFGHLLGLGHSEVRDSTMLFTTFKGQHTPHQDDTAGIRKIYSSSSFGRITGKLIGGNQVPVFGGHVQAISSRNGAIAGASISNEDGSFSIQGLALDDTYYLYIEPLNYLSSLPDAFRSVKNDFCPGEYVGSFFEKCGSAGKGRPQPIKLSTGAASVEVGAVTVRCQLRVGEDYLLEKVTHAQGVYDFTASSSQPGTALVGYYPVADPLPTGSYSAVYTDTVNIDLSELSLPAGALALELKLLTTSFGSALDFSFEISGPAGTVTDPDRPWVGGQPVIDEDPDTERPIYERVLTYPLNANPALNVFSVRLSPRALSALELSRHMPRADLFVTRDRPWLLLVSVLRNGLPYYQNQTQAIEDNSRCIDAPYAFAVRANPVSAAALAGQSEEGASEAQTTGASCGTWQPPGGSGPSAGHGLLLVALGFLFTRFRWLKRLS